MQPENERHKKNDERAASEGHKRLTAFERPAIKCLYTRQGALMYDTEVGGFFAQKDGAVLQVDAPAIYQIQEIIRPDGSMWFQIISDTGEIWREVNANTVSEIDYFTKDAAAGESQHGA